jgi:hypothetical protein
MEQTQTESICIIWIGEELSELSASRTNADRIDALLDMIGVALLELIQYENDEVENAFQEYLRSQANRGRSIDLPHVYMMIAMLTTMAGHDERMRRAEAVRIMNRKADSWAKETV